MMMWRVYRVLDFESRTKERGRRRKSDFVYKFTPPPSLHSIN